MRILPLLLICAAIGCTRHAPVQTESAAPADESVIVSDVLSNLKINSFAQDSLGHIWIGTFRGLNRFNSYEYVQYFCTDDEEDIPDNQINTVFCDSKGQVWVATVNGVCVYSDRGRFRRVGVDSWDQNCTQFIEDKSGRLFLSNIFQLMVYDPEQDRFVCVDEELDPGMTINERMYVDKGNSLWIVNPQCLRRFDTALSSMADSVAVTGTPSVSYLQDERRLWLAGRGGVQIFDLLTRRFEDVPAAFESDRDFAGATVRMIQPFDRGLVFDTESDGLFFYSFADGSLSRQGGEGFPFEAPDFRINSMFTDTDGNLWIGSEDRGYEIRYGSDRKFNNDRSLCRAFENRTVTSLSYDPAGRLWAAVYRDGLWMYDFGAGKAVRVAIPSMQDSSGINVSYVYVTKDGTLWLVFESGKVLECRWSGGGLALQRSYDLFGARYITEDEQGTMWVTCNGWFVFSKKRGERDFTAFSVFEPGFIFVPSILPMGDGTLLTGGLFQGLKVIGAQDGSAEDLQGSEKELSVEDLPVSEEDLKACIHRSVYIPVDLYRDSAGDVWIATIANGLLKYSPSTGRMEPVGGISCSDVSAVREDLLGNLWVSTLHGLCQWDRQTGEFINWFAYDGTGGDQFSERTSCILPDGRLVFGGTHGLTVLDPSQVNSKRTVSVVFEDLKVYNKRVSPEEGGIIDRRLSLRPDVRLKHSQNGFSISFSALYYSEYQRVHYAYRLEGFDNFWIDAKTAHEAYYANLPTGRYTFTVWATDNDKSIVSAANSIRIRVLPSPWLSWWAYCIYVLVVLAVGTYIFILVRRIRAEQKEASAERLAKEQEQKVNKMNMSFFSNVSHEFRTPLTMISGPVKQLCDDPSVSEGNRKLLQIVGRSVDRMLKLVNQLLDFNKLENDALRLSVRRTDIVAELRQYAEVYRTGCEKKSIEMNAYLPDDNFLMYLDVDKLDKIIANLMSNAIKFTPSRGSIDLTFNVLSGSEAQGLVGGRGVCRGEWQYVGICVEDSGSGIPQDKLEKIFERYYQLDGSNGGSYNYGSGIGLYYARRLAGLHHGWLWADNRMDGQTGAAFILILPADDQAYAESEIDRGAQSQSMAYPLSERPDSVERPDTVEPEVDEEDSDASETGNRRPTVLVVDDDPDVVHYLQTLLSDHYRAVSRFDADSALAIMRKDPPDVLLCDVAMPGKSGYDLCREVKSDLQLCHIPVIMLTAKAAPQDAVEGMDSGAEAYVTKPFDPSVLLSAINSLLRNRERISMLLTSSTTVETISEDNLSSQDKAFMEDLYRLMEASLTNSELNVIGIAEQLHISRTKMYYKVKALTGENPSNFFKTYKLNRAAELLREGRYTISEIADLTGFSTLSHFSISFKKQFGVPPSEYGK